jgi:hypothetical protein
MSENIRQCPALAIMAQSPFPGGAGAFDPRLHQF